MSPRATYSAACATWWNSSSTFSLTWAGTCPSAATSLASSSISSSEKWRNTSAEASSPSISVTMAALRSPERTVWTATSALLLVHPGAQQLGDVLRLVEAHRRHPLGQHRQLAIAVLQVGIELRLDFALEISHRLERL